MIEASRKHGPFDSRWQLRDPLPAAADVRDADVPDGLDWEAFCARAFPGMRRHDFRAIKAYEAYGNADDGRNARRQALEYAESDAENEGMPPKPEAMSARPPVSQGARP